MQGNIVELSQEKLVVSLRKKKQSTFWLPQVATVFLCMFGCVFSVSKSWSIPLQPLNIMLIVMIPIIFSVAFLHSKHTLKYLIVLIMLWVTWLGTNYQYILEAYHIVGAHFVESVNYYYGTHYIVYGPIIKNEEYYYTLSFFMNNLIFLLSFYFSAISIRMKSVFLSAFILVPCTFLSLNFAETPYEMPLLLILLGFFSIMIGKNAGRKSYKITAKQKGNHFKQKFNLRISKISGASFTAAIISVFLIIAITIAVVFNIVPYNQYEPFDYKNFDELNLLYIKLKDKITIKSVGRQYYSGGISYGSIANGDGIKYSNDVHFQVKSAKNIPMYLKGYVGSLYYENGWHDYDEQAVNEYEQWFTGFFSPQQLYSLDTAFRSAVPQVLENLDNTFSPVENIVSIRMLKSDYQYMLMPYFPNSSQRFVSFDTAKMNDRVISNDFGEEYTIEALLYPSSLIRHLNSQETQYFDNEEQMRQERYYEFAKSTYTRIPTEEIPVIVAASNEIRKSFGANLSAEEAIRAVKEYITQRTVYSLKPGRTPTDRDFAEYFLFQNQKGYCTHYATAAALMLRAMNIPTRYVEGYVVTEQDYEEMQRQNRDSMDIKDTNAHAWIEVYFPYIGWVPYEMTPGYSDIQTQTLDNIITINSEMEENKPFSSMEEISSEAALSSDTSSEETSNASSLIEHSESLSESTLSSASNQNPNSNDMDSTNGKDKTDQTGKNDGQGNMVLFMLALMLFILAVAFILYRRWIIRKRGKSFIQSDKKQAIIALFQYTTELLSLLGYQLKEHESLEAYAKAVENDMTVVKEQEYQQIIEIVQKARFSNHEITQEEYQTVYAFTHRLNNRILAHMNFAKCLWYKIIKGY